jgi:cytosine/adenosine deaminase-related metal-dependent hydrolase
MQGVEIPESPTTDGLILRNAGAAWIGPPGERALRRNLDIEIAAGIATTIGAVGPAGDGVREVDASNWLVVPGFVNAHHHLSQQLTRTCAVRGDLIEWLTELYPRWARIDAEMAHAAAAAGIAELLLSGVTTVSDFTYFYPRGHADIFDAQVDAARQLGCRFHPVRGGLAELEAAVRARLGDGLGAALESRDELLSEVERTVAAYHDPAPTAMCRVGVGLTEKAYGDEGLMLELAALAERHDLRLHTHLHPRADERELARSGERPGAVEFLQATGWWTDRLWVAHGTQLLPDELEAMAHGGVGLCTCPSSNARFGMPIAPAHDLHALGGKVAVGVDGTASNDAGDFISECRLAWQVQRIRGGSAQNGQPGPTIDEVLEWGSAGGAAVLGWPQIGSLVEGGLGDVACFDLSGFEYAGAVDSLAALLLCGVGRRASFVAVGGRPVVEDGQLLGVDEEELSRSAHRAAEGLWAVSL